MVGYKQALQRTGGKKAKSRGWINANTQYNEFRDNADFKHKREKKRKRKKWQKRKEGPQCMLSLPLREMILRNLKRMKF